MMSQAAPASLGRLAHSLIAFAGRCTAMLEWTWLATFGRFDHEPDGPASSSGRIPLSILSNSYRF